MKLRESVQLVRLALALLLAPLAAPIVSVSLAYGIATEGKDSGFAWVFGFAAAFGYFGLFFCGIPILIALRRLQQVNLVALTIAGAIAGIVIFQLALITFELLLGSSGGNGSGSIAFGAMEGAAVACCFGLAAGIDNLKSNTTTE